MFVKRKFKQNFLRSELNIDILFLFIFLLFNYFKMIPILESYLYKTSKWDIKTEIIIFDTTAIFTTYQGTFFFSDWSLKLSFLIGISCFLFSLEIYVKSRIAVKKI